MKIKVCVPFYSEFEAAKAGLRQIEDSGIGTVFFAQGPLVAQARNALINNQKDAAIWQNLGTEYDYFLFVDSDISFQLSHVLALLAISADVAALPYVRHQNRNQYQSGDLGPLGQIQTRHGIEMRGVHRVDWCGAGFLLIKREVFSKIPYPWFRYGVIETDGHAEIVGEDLCFCLATKNAGIEIFCDFDNPVQHRHRDVNSFDYNY